MINNQKGQILPIIFMILGVVLFTVLSVVAGAQIYYQNASYSQNAEAATALAEAGIDKAITALNSTGGSYNGEKDVSMGEGTYNITITNIDAATKSIESEGYIPSRIRAEARRTIKVNVSKGVGISFVYGILTGEGGISMGTGSTINGSVYSNGSISGGNNESITGDAWVAGGTQPNADQQSDCASPYCTDFIFGKTVTGNNQLDAAQSFKPVATAVINKVSLKLKKIGSPSNPTVYILSDSSGQPSKTILTSGTLSASLVTSQYGFVDVTFSSSPTLSANTTYWIMIAAQSLDSSNYWAWSQDLNNDYTGGSPAWSSNWQASHPSWNAITGDLGFKTWMGGVTTSVSMGNGSVIGGNIHANTINGMTITKDAYYQVISNATVHGMSHPNSTDPVPIALPISAANITDWEATAAQSGTTTGDLSGCPASIGPGKVVGNFTTGNNCTIKVITPFWLTGNLLVGNSVIFKMDSSLGSSSGVMIIDGTTTFQNGDDLRGTGLAGSYLTLLSTYNSHSVVAISTGNSSITGILYAPFGILSLANNATFKEAVAWQLNMGNGTILTYDSGLINTFFTTGPSGSFALVKGTYQVK